MSNRVEHPTLNQVIAELPSDWVFGVQLGLRETQALIKAKTIRRGKVPPAILLLSSVLLLNSNIAGGTFPLLIGFVLINAYTCRRPSWTPKTQPGGSSAATSLSFWCSTRLLIPKKADGAVRTVPFFFIFEKRLTAVRTLPFVFICTFILATVLLYGKVCVCGEGWGVLMTDVCCWSIFTIFTLVQFEEWTLTNLN